MHPSVRSLYRKVLKGNANDVSKLDLREENIGPDNVRMLAMTLPYTLNLEHIYMKQNAIGGSGTQYLVDGLEMLTQKKTSDDEMAAHRPLLSELCIEHNGLGTVGGYALGAALRHLQGLIVLKLDGNSIGDEGICAIAKGLPQVTNLHNLGLDGNEISDEGLEALGNALHRLRKLHVLWIERNRIGNSGAEALATKLPHSLRFIWIGGNPLLEAEGISTLRKTVGSVCQVFT
jgi:Ran GTPase-activating protein (RanGAP) involved in mRNA processing and transport